MKKIIRFPFDFLAIIYINFTIVKNTDHFIDFDEYHREVCKRYNIWVDRFDYKIAIIFWVLMIIYIFLY